MTNHSDSNIRFDANGYCHYCTQALIRCKNEYFPNAEGEHKLNEMLKEIKEYGKENQYDCLMGISGGLDSAYLAYLGTQKWGLKVAALHIDDGFDTEIAQENIKKLCEKCKIALQIIRPDAKQYRELIRAYFLAGVPNLAVPQDNILFSHLHDFARATKTKYFLSGGNFALECILQEGNTYTAYDAVNIKDINKKFGRDKTDRLSILSQWGRARDYYSGKIIEERPLNYIDYNRQRAIDELGEFCGFQYYGSKHLENLFTAFVQLYWFPKKFGVDKRTSHLSSMIVSDQMTRDAAMEKMSEPLYDEEWMKGAIERIKDEFDFSDDEFDKIIKSLPHQHTDYKVDKRYEFVFRTLPKWKKKVFEVIGKRGTAK